MYSDYELILALNYDLNKASFITECKVSLVWQAFYSILIQPWTQFKAHLNQPIG